MSSRSEMTLDWYAASDTAHIQKNLESIPAPFMYVVYGKVKYQRKVMLQTFGVGKSLGDVMADKGLRLIARDRVVWVGFVSPSNFLCHSNLERPSPACYAESIFRMALKPRVAKSAVRYDIFKSARILSRWWSPEFYNMRISPTDVDWPDVIEYNGIDGSILTLKLDEINSSIAGVKYSEPFEPSPFHLKKQG